MALYTYVPGKAELLDLMLDTVYGELATTYPLDNGWRAAVEASARATWALYARHPWVLQVAGTRALLGPGELDLYESQLRLFDGLGLTAVDIMPPRLASSPASSVAPPRRCPTARSAEQATGVSDDDWWNARSPYLDELSADVWTTRYPTIAKLSEEHAFEQLDRPDDETPYMVQDALDTFEFGMQRLLDGLESYIGSRKQ